MAGSKIEIYRELEVVAEHGLAEGRGAMVLDPAHYAGLSERRVDRKPSTGIQPIQATELTPGPGVGHNFVPPEVEQRSLSVYEEVADVAAI